MDKRIRELRYSWNEKKRQAEIARKKQKTTMDETFPPKASLSEAVRQLEQLPQLSLTSPPCQLSPTYRIGLDDPNRELIVALTVSASAATATIDEHVDWAMNEVVIPCADHFMHRFAKLTDATPFGSHW